MLCLPECFSYVGEKWQDTVAAGQSIDDETGVIAEMRAHALENDIWLSLGGFPEIASEPEQHANSGSGSNSHSRVYNSHLIVDNRGQISAVYRKIHLFDVEVPNGPVMLESRYTAPGSKMTMMQGSPIGNLGLSTCYDVRFPEMYIKLVELGAQVCILV